MTANKVSDSEEANVRNVLTATAKVLRRELREASQGDRAMLIVSVAPGRVGRVHTVGDFDTTDELRSFLEYALKSMDSEKHVWTVPE